MNPYHLQEDVQLMCTTVTTFPNGITEAFKSLQHLLTDEQDRPFYGISYFNEEGNIVYKAAATTTSEEEAKRYGLEYFVIPKGRYISETLVNWMDQLPNIGNTFSAMMKDERADSSFPCIEWYKSDIEMMCMMRTKQQELQPLAL